MIRTRIVILNYQDFNESKRGITQFGIVWICLLLQTSYKWENHEIDVNLVTSSSMVETRIYDRVSPRNCCWLIVCSGIFLQEDSLFSASTKTCVGNDVSLIMINRT